MQVCIGEIYLWVNWASSLKEKRSVVKSLLEKTRNKFHVSIAEIAYLDHRQKIAIGFACVSNSQTHATTMAQKILNFIESNTDAIVDNSFIEPL